MKSEKNRVLLGIVMLIIAVLYPSNILGQIGFSCCYSTKNSIGSELIYTIGQNRFCAGFSYQMNGQKDKIVSERKATYGTTPTDTGDFFWTIDLGYGRKFLNKLTIGSELSVGSRSYFTNYLDRRFKDNGYSLIIKTRAVQAIGLNFGYLINKTIEPFCGFNTVKKATFGIRFYIIEL